MRMRERDYMKRPDKYFHKVYNAGIAEFGSMEKEYDKFGTPIGTQTFQSKMKAWYRHLGVTASDVYYASADDKEVNRKLAIKGHVEVDTKWHVKIQEKTYAVYRVFYAFREDETEISLVEVGS